MALGMVISISPVFAEGNAIHFDLNGGNGSPIEDIAPDEYGIDMPDAADSSLDGNRFLYWTESKDGSGKIYYPNKFYSNSYLNNSFPHVLYAQYPKMKKIVLNFSLDEFTQNNFSHSNYGGAFYAIRNDNSLLKVQQISDHDYILDDSDGNNKKERVTIHPYQYSDTSLKKYTINLYTKNVDSFKLRSGKKNLDDYSDSLSPANNAEEIPLDFSDEPTEKNIVLTWSRSQLKIKIRPFVLPDEPLPNKKFPVHVSIYDNNHQLKDAENYKIFFHTKKGEKGFIHPIESNERHTFWLDLDDILYFDDVPYNFFYRNIDGYGYSGYRYGEYEGETDGDVYPSYETSASGYTGYKTQEIILRYYRVGYDFRDKKADIKFIKKWNDNGNESKRPENVTFYLATADHPDVPLEEITINAQANLYNDDRFNAFLSPEKQKTWIGRFRRIPLRNYKTGKTYKYIVREKGTDNYVPSYEDNINVTDYEKEYATTITNTYTKLMNISFKKIWKLQENEKTPEKAEFELYRNNSENPIRKIMLYRNKDSLSKTQWKGTFRGLRTLDDEGKEIKYSIKEVPVKGFKTVYKTDKNLSEAENNIIENISDKEKISSETEKSLQKKQKKPKKSEETSEKNPKKPIRKYQKQNETEKTEQPVNTGDNTDTTSLIITALLSVLVLSVLGLFARKEEKEEKNKNSNEAKK